ncbi:MAG: 16S rRNA (cytosine(1402)-N(4))-methyltransferase RsmH [Bacillus subtilis]|nr:16S rRNA (cytosine(1402)-N(4))-methyltransferase RsmH [Bacillus subtilis]
MLEEAVEWLNCKNGKIYIDATAGGGGHSKEIAKRISPDGRLLSFDVDPDAINAASEALKPYEKVATVIKSSYVKIPEVLNSLNIDKITGGILYDLGASYHQFNAAEKGFSFSKEAPLDMRFNPESSINAYDIVNNYPEEQLAQIFKEYGEERYSRRIARKNCRNSSKKRDKNHNRAC